MASVAFYFDFACPWSYLASARLRETSLRTDSVIVWKPFDLEDIDARNNLRARHAEGNAWADADLQAWADYCGLKLRLPADWPIQARPALRAVAHAIESGVAAGALVTALFRAVYEQGLDVSASGVLGDIAASLNLDAPGLVAAMEDPAGDESLRANAQELESRGGFRSATMFVGDRMFCGNSRMPLVEFALGQASERQFVMPGQHG